MYNIFTRKINKKLVFDINTEKRLLIFGFTCSRIYSTTTLYILYTNDTIILCFCKYSCALNFMTFTTHNKHRPRMNLE